MDKIGSWNIRGLNDPIKQHAIRKFISQHYFSVLVVVETKVKFNKWSQIANNCGYGLECIHNYASADSGRI